MSDNVPFEIQEEIIKKLPVNSLIRFRSVSKSWKSLIDSSDFVANYSSRQQHLLVRYKNSEPRYVSIVDDDTFPHQTVTLTLPPLVQSLNYYMTVGSSHGLLCLYPSCDEGSFASITGRGLAVIWNPCIRKAVDVVVPNVADGKVFKTELGFGVCRVTSDPKIVKITYNRDRIKDMESGSSIPWQVEIFTLSTGIWRSLCSDLPPKSIYFGYSKNVDGVCYWLASDGSNEDLYVGDYSMIVSFDMTSEKFREITIPDNFKYGGSMHNLFLSNLRGSLVMLEHNEREGLFDVWLIEDGVPKSFTKLYSIHAPAIQEVLVFRKSGKPVIRLVKGDCGGGDELSLIVGYEPNSEHIFDLGFNGVGLCYMHSYMETLLLHNHPSTEFREAKWQLESTAATTTDINPPIPSLQDYITRFANLQRSIEATAQDVFLTLADIISKYIEDNEQTHFTCQATIVEITPGRNWHYVRCPVCQHKLFLQNGETTSFVCKDDDLIPEPLFMFYVNTTIVDETTTAKATFFNEAMAELLGKSCKEMVIKDGHTDPTIIPAEIFALRGQPAVLRVTMKKDSPMVVNKATKKQTITPDTQLTAPKRHIEESLGSTNQPPPVKCQKK